MEDPKTPLIPGGYYIKARKTQESKIAHAPPHVREIWDWLLKEANHADNQICKRGQCVRSYKDIRDGLLWKVGYRTQRYSKSQCEISMKWLKKATMITTTKTTRGIIITICNYDLYQNPANYESHKRTTTKATMEPQWSHTINKNDKNDNNKNYPENSEFQILLDTWAACKGKSSPIKFSGPDCETFSTQIQDGLDDTGRGFKWCLDAMKKHGAEAVSPKQCFYYKQKSREKDGPSGRNEADSKGLSEQKEKDDRREYWQEQVVKGKPIPPHIIERYSGEEWMKAAKPGKDIYAKKGRG